MPVLIVALRPFTDHNNQTKLTDRYTQIHAKDHTALFRDVPKVLEGVPENKRYNLYFSAYYALPDSHRR